jgi:cytidylate kinase
MAIITISRDSFSRGKQIAEAVAERLSYQCISREVILDTSEHFNIPEIKLYRAIHDAPSILDRFTLGRERYVAFFRSTLLDYLRGDNIVYHGLAGQFFVQDIPHAVKVRIVVNMEDRIQLEVQTEKVSRAEALRSLRNDDEQRRKWSQALYGIDTQDPTLYDLLVHTRNLAVSDVADIVCHTAERECFATTQASRKVLDDSALSAKVQAALINLNPHVEVKADDGRVHVRVRAQTEQCEMVDQIRAAAGAVRGVRAIEVEVLPFSLYSN